MLMLAHLAGRCEGKQAQLTCKKRTDAKAERNAAAMCSQAVLLQGGLAGELKVADATIVVLKADVVIVVRQGLKCGQAVETGLGRPCLLTMSLVNKV